MGFSNINEEQKVRITLSDRAQLVMLEDMAIFHTSRPATFINTVFHNFRNESTASIEHHLKQQELELDRLFTEANLDAKSKEIAIRQMNHMEKRKIMDRISSYQSLKGTSKLYHINDSNVEYLLEDCDEEENYKNKPSLYIRSVIEEYCSLPFIERERIYRKEIYDIVEQACKEHRILKIKTNSPDTDNTFYVYPYKIVPDFSNSQSYLVCYSRTSNKGEKDKITASFSMARLATPTMLTKTFHLSKHEIDTIEEKITKYSPAYLIGKPEMIEVRLTSNGKNIYNTKLFSRPDKIEHLSTDDVYVFDCTKLQISNYFFSFGSDAEILSPPALREQFKKAYLSASELYND